MDDLKKDKQYVKKYLSHPNKFLHKHISGTETRALEMHSNALVYYACKFHDLGKLNENFAKKLKGIKTGEYSNHSYLSFLIADIFYEICKKSNNVLFSEKELIAILACVIKHHGSLLNLYELINKEEAQRLDSYLKTKPYIPAYALLELIGLDKVEPFEIVCPINPINNKSSLGSMFTTNSLDKNILINERLDFYFNIRLCFSALVYGDKGDAGNQDLKSLKKQFATFIKAYPTKIDRYIEKKFGKESKFNELNRKRTLIRNEVLNRLEFQLLNTDNHCFSLTCPTGSGKTIMLMALSKIILAKKTINKVIYSIPFLTITEQVFDEIEKIFDNNFDCIKRIDSKALPTEDFDFDNEQNKSKLNPLIKKIKSKLGLEKDQIERLLQQEYLESSFDFPLIVTTFVQFFQSFTTSSNKGLMKFAHFKNSVFLIDELQALPPNLYTFFVALIDEFCRKFNSYAIFSTATMPFLEIPETDTESKAKEFFCNYKVPVELADSSYFKFSVFNRYTIIPLKGQFFANTICKEIIKNNVPTLIVVNTIKDSRDIYEILSSQAKNVYLINSNFHACDRREILDKVKKYIGNKEQVFLVSTQLIEAGVDISFDIVYRDIASLPHIIQTAGRCNRENKLNKGIVYLFKLYKETESNIRLRARTIYNGIEEIFLDKTIQFFFGSDKSLFEECELLPVQKEFFEFVSNNLKLGQWIDENDNKVNFIEQIKKYQYGNIGRFFVIPREIRKNQIQVQFYVPENDKDENYEKLCELIVEQFLLDESKTNENEDKLRKILALKSRINKHLRKMMDRVVQASINKDESLLLYTSNDYASSFCNLYKLKLEFYSSVFGLNI